MRGASAGPAPFDAPALARRLSAALAAAPRPPTRLAVAWSGGADSTALLAALVEIRRRRLLPRLPPLRAIHVDHGLHADSAAWARRCLTQGRQWRVPVEVLRVDVDLTRGESPEAAARDARHASFANALAADEWLLLAHHADDQLETTLLRWLRGAGPVGLSGMRMRRSCGRGQLVRPLLDVSRDALRDWLEANGIGFVEDPSNADPRFDRNYLRAHVLPPLLARWPAAARTAGRAASHLAVLQQALDGETRRWLDAVRDGEDLSLPLLRRLAPPKRAAVLRAWIAERGARAPEAARLKSMLATLDTRADAQTVVAWDGCELRRHDARLVLVRAASASPPADERWQWSRARALELPAGRLSLRADGRGEVDLDALPATLVVRGRPDGRALGAAGERVDVKAVLQQARVPAWRRGVLPFVHDDAVAEGAPSLVAIADLWLSDAFRARAKGGRRGRFVWQAR